MHPISATKDIIEFCYRVEVTDPLQIVDIACAEAHYHRQSNTRLTRATDFRSGSKGRRYCEQLQSLITIFVNGQVPQDVSPELRQAIAPLVRRVLNAGWRVGDLALEFADDT